MILYTDETTPFGRKCLVAALERNIVLEEIFVKLSDPKEFMLINPLNQIPALSVGQQKYFDSEMWCQFQEYIPEFDKDESFKRFIEVCSATVKGFHFKDWLKEFNYD